MPVIVGAGAVITPPPPAISTGPVPLSVIYVDPDGGQWSLSDRDGDVHVTALTGLGGPPSLLTVIGLPGGGALPQQMIPAIRTIILGLFVEAGEQGDFLALQDSLARAFWTQRGGAPSAGTLIVGRPDGTARQIAVYCTTGLDQADDDSTKSGLAWSTYTLTFQAPDPLFADAEPVTIEFVATPVGAGVPPMPPVDLAPGSVLGLTTVTNSGDADAYAVWTIFGPGTPVLSNLTTGLAFGLNAPLGPTEVVTVDTRPGMQSAIDGTGANRWANLVQADPRDLWPLLPGDNDLDLTLGGSGPTSAIVMSYTRRWLRA